MEWNGVRMAMAMGMGIGRGLNLNKGLPCSYRSILLLNTTNYPTRTSQDGYPGSKSNRLKTESKSEPDTESQEFSDF